MEVLRSAQYRRHAHPVPDEDLMRFHAHMHPTGSSRQHQQSQRPHGDTATHRDRNRDWGRDRGRDSEFGRGYGRGASSSRRGPSFARGREHLFSHTEQHRREQRARRFLEGPRAKARRIRLEAAAARSRDTLSRTGRPGEAILLRSAQRFRRLQANRERQQTALARQSRNVDKVIQLPSREGPGSKIDTERKNRAQSKKEWVTQKAAEQRKTQPMPVGLESGELPSGKPGTKAAVTETATSKQRQTGPSSSGAGSVFALSRLGSKRRPSASRSGAEGDQGSKRARTQPTPMQLGRPPPPPWKPGLTLPEQQGLQSPRPKASPLASRQAAREFLDSMFAQSTSPHGGSVPQARPPVAEGPGGRRGLPPAEPEGGRGPPQSPESPGPTGQSVLGPASSMPREGGRGSDRQPTPEKLVPYESSRSLSPVREEGQDSPKQ